MTGKPSLGVNWHVTYELPIRPRRMSIECLYGTKHFNQCPKMNCSCVCHEIDGEADWRERRERPEISTGETMG